MKQGIEQGEKLKALEIAKEMLKNGADIEFIVKCTGVTKDEIEEIKKTIDANTKNGKN